MIKHDLSRRSRAWRQLTSIGSAQAIRGSVMQRSAQGQKSGGDMLYELRVYYCSPGRLPDLNKRFDTITLKLWEKHGIRQVGFWTVVIGESNNVLYYMLEWKDLAERERIWNAFATDPEWLKSRAETERNGPLITHLTNSILTPTSYSKMK